jgi:hypothetical protein
MMLWTYIFQEIPPELAGMEPIEPDPIPFSTDTPAWKVVWVILALLILYGLFKAYRKYRANAYRREALVALEDIAKKPHAVKSIMFLLKRTALIGYPRQEVAGLEGDAWLAFLDGTLPEGGFSPLKEVIHAAIYKDETTEVSASDIDRLINLSKIWIRKHG